MIMTFVFLQQQENHARVHFGIVFFPFAVFRIQKGVHHTYDNEVTLVIGFCLPDNLVLQFCVGSFL